MTNGKKRFDEPVTTRNFFDVLAHYLAVFVAVITVVSGVITYVYTEFVTKPELLSVQNALIREIDHLRAENFELRAELRIIRDKKEQ